MVVKSLLLFGFLITLINSGEGANENAKEKENIRAIQLPHIPTSPQDVVNGILELTMQTASLVNQINEIIDTIQSIGRKKRSAPNNEVKAEIPLNNRRKSFVYHKKI